LFRFSIFSDSFIDEDPQKALEELNEALKEESDKAEWLCQRAYAHILLKNYSRKFSLYYPNQTCELIAEYHLENYESAHAAFTQGHQLDGEHDWYQTESQVIVTVMAKNVPKEGVPLFLSRAPDSTICLNIVVWVFPPPSTVSLFCQVEIKMKKTDAIRWEKLEGEGQESNIKHWNPNQYPTSSHYTHKWDKMVLDISEEEKNEKLEGDAALNKLFQQIYTDGSDEVKRAMNKSFMESGGTVLSTNWGDVGRRTVEVSPPDDAEFKKY
uniref:SGT1 homolog, MIS12 kinetochore complex assembly cochaperone n=1 Tax=Nothobranchius furzeri TaxID=105023 RepID=A0A8C6NLZ4_NOTFU